MILIYLELIHIRGGGGKYLKLDSKNLSQYIQSLESNLSKDYKLYNQVDSKTKSIITCIQADVTNLSNIESNSIESFSILGALGAMGLGLYGEPINPSAWEQALLSVQRILKGGGKFILATQIGKKDMLHFNSGRTFKLQTICDTLKDMDLIELNFLHSHELEIYNCIYKCGSEIIINEQNLQYFLSQDSVSALMEFEKININS